MNKNRVGTARMLFGSVVMLVSSHAFGGMAVSCSFVQEQARWADSDSDSHDQVEAEPEVGTISPVSQNDFAHSGFSIVDATERRFTITHVFQLAMVASVFLLSYSLLTAGRHGRGWFVLAVMLGILAVLTKSILSLFLVVADSKSMPEWDEDEG